MRKHTSKTISFLEDILSNSETGTKGLAELKQLYDYAKILNHEDLFQIDLTLARGLNYYTGSIFEVSANDVKMGSICGGGRYDD